MTLTTERGPDVPVLDAVPVIDDEQLARQLQATKFRLMTELRRGDVPTRKLCEAFDRICQSMNDASVRAFLPILVERAVRAEFECASVVAPRSAEACES